MRDTSTVRSEERFKMASTCGSNRIRRSVTGERARARICGEFAEFNAKHIDIFTPL